MDIASSPQPLAVGEKHQNNVNVNHTDPTKTYAAQLRQKQSAATMLKMDLCPVTLEHGELTINFTIDEVNEFTREEGLHQAVIMKFSYGKPDIQEVRRQFQSQFQIQGSFTVGQLEYRHLLIRFDVYADYVQFMSRSVGHLTFKGDEYMFRTFPWTLGFNPKEETSMSVVWISLPALPPNFFAKKSIMSIASAVGKPLAVDKATQDRTRPSTARVKVLIDLLDEHPTKVKLRVVDKSTGKYLVMYQDIMYDNLPKYCCCCKHQGHDEQTCRFVKKNNEENDNTADGNLRRNYEDNSNRKRTGAIEENAEQLQGDARSFLNAKRISQGVGEIPLHEQLKANDGDKKATGNTLISATVDGATIANHGRADNSVSATVDAVKIRSTELQKVATAGVVTSDEDRDIEHVQSDTYAPDLQADDQFIGNKNKGKTAVHELSKDTCKVDNDKGGIQRKKNEVWTVATSRKSSAKKPTATGHLTQQDRQNTLGNVSSSNKFDLLGSHQVEQSELPTTKETKDNNAGTVVTSTNAVNKPSVKTVATMVPDSNAIESLAEIKGNKLEPTVQTREKMCKQIVHCNVAEQHDKTGANLDKKADDRIEIYTDLEELNIMTHQGIPTVQFSSSHVERIIKETQKDMLIQSKLVKFFKPMVMLNTSIQDVPSQSFDSYGEFGGELVVLTDNNKEVPNTDWKGTTSNSKSWTDQSGDGEEGDISSTEEEEDENDECEEEESDECEEDESDECEEDMTSPISPSTPKMASNTECQSNYKLNAKAPHFVPKAGGQQVTQVRLEAGQQHEKNHTQDGKDGQQQHSGILHDHEIKNAENGMQQSPTGQTKPNVGQQHIVQTTASSSARNQPRRGMPRFRNTYRSGEVPIQCDTLEMANEYIARVSEETTVRQLPMRVAKQKQVVSNTSNRYKK